MTLTESNETALVPASSSSSLVALSAPISEIAQAQRAYHDVCVQLLDDNDIQVIGKKNFKKRSAWNKLAVAFGVSTTIVSREHERDERGRIVRTECVVRATAPNGRMSDGIGACDLYERCCDPRTCTKKEVWEDSGKPTGHVHCAGYPCTQAHFSNPQHDIPATAFTRASNRAKADLFGMGEVSAEEISDDGTNTYLPGEQMQTTRTGPAASQPSGNGAKAKNTEAMRKRIFAVSKSLGLTMDDAISCALGVSVAEDDMDFAQCRKVNDWLSEEVERQKNGGPIDAVSHDAGAVPLDAR